MICTNLRKNSKISIKNHLQPKKFIKYVDDIFSIIPSESVDDTLCLKFFSSQIKVDI